MATLAPVVLVLLPLLILPGILFYWDVTPKAAVLLFGYLHVAEPTSGTPDPLIAWVRVSGRTWNRGWVT